MAQQKTDKSTGHDPFLAALDAKIHALQTLRASYVAAVSIGAFSIGDSSAVGVVGAGAPVSMGAPMELPRGALLGKSLPAAIKLYLSAVKQKQTIKEITAALREGGVESTSDNFENIVTGALNRLKRATEVLRFKDGWALAEFYPDSLRAKIGAASEAKPKKKGKKATASRKSAKKAAQPSAAQSKPEIVTAFLADNPGVSYTSAELATASGVPSVGLGIVLMHLQRAGRVKKDSDGRYRAA